MVVIVIFAMTMHLLMVVRVGVRRAIGVGVRVLVIMGVVMIVIVRVFVRMLVLMRVHRTVGMHMTVAVFAAFDLHFTGCAAANCTHGFVSKLFDFDFLDPHFRAPRGLHLIAAALRANTEAFG